MDGYKNGIIHKDVYELPSEIGDKTISKQTNKVTIHGVDRGNGWESVTIVSSEAFCTSDGECFGTSNSVRLHKPRAIAAARAILKHFGEDCGPAVKDVW